MCWDISQGAAIAHFKSAHMGHVTALHVPASRGALPWDFASGGQDGMLKAWDVR